MFTVQDYDCGITEKARGKGEEQARLKGDCSDVASHQPRE